MTNRLLWSCLLLTFLAACQFRPPAIPYHEIPAAPPDARQRLVLVFADVKSWKGRAGLSAESRARLAALLARPATVVCCGHPRRLADIPGTAGVLCAWSGDEAIQRAAAKRLVQDGG